MKYHRAKKGPAPKSKRNHTILQLRRQGLPFTAIAKRFHLAPQRAEFIAKREAARTTSVP